MADKTQPKNPSRKRPVSQMRVAVVLASLVGTMTIGAGTLLLLEGGALGTNVPGAMVVANDHLVAQVEPSRPLQTRAWNYIIIYESADVAASASSLSEGLESGGNPHNSVRPKAKFHFVIDSAQSGEGCDGKLEVGASWQLQEAGAPKASWPDPRSYLYTPYTNAIGICLAADLNRTPLSDAQTQKLVQLVQLLQRRYNIHKEGVLFQWDRRLDARPMSRTQQGFDQNFHSQLD